MSTMVADESEEQFELLEEFERDLPSVACRAGIELDDLVRGRGSKLHAIRRLVSDIEGSLTTVQEPEAPASLLNPTTVVVLNGAISDLISRQPASIPDLIEQAKAIVKNLKAVVANPENSGEEQLGRLRQMRTFCLKLCNRASSLEPSRYDIRPAHPFRS